jgi:hypothetical protein
MRFAATAALIAALLPTSPRAAPPAARAAERETPLLIPTRDVDVSYKIAEGHTERMRWQVSASRLRVDPPVADLYVLVDLTSHHIAVVRTGARTVEEIVSAGLPVPAPGPAGFVRGPSAEVAGLPCIEWSTRDDTGRQTLSCLTADGVLLRSRLTVTGANGEPGQTALLLEATRVTYGPIEPNSFTIPPDYTHSKQDAAPP